MRVAIHQPEYWPLPRVLAKWAAVDVFILLDTVQFDRASCQHRARLQRQLDHEACWLTIPYKHQGVPQLLPTLQSADPKWAMAHWWRIKAWYDRHVAAPELAVIEQWYLGAQSGSTQTIATIAGDTFRFCAHLLDMDLPPVYLASSLAPLEESVMGSTYLLRLCKALNATTYLAGETSASSYLDWDAFRRAGVTIEVQQFVSPYAVGAVHEFSSLHEYLIGPSGLRSQVRQGA